MASFKPLKKWVAALWKRRKRKQHLDRKSHLYQQHLTHEILSQKHIVQEKVKMQQRLEKKVRNHLVNEEQKEAHKRIDALLTAFLSQDETARFWGSTYKEQKALLEQWKKKGILQAAPCTVIDHWCKHLKELDDFAEEMERNKTPEPYFETLKEVIHARQLASALISCFDNAASTVLTLCHRALLHYIQTGTFLEKCSTEYVSLEDLKHAIQNDPTTRHDWDAFCGHLVPLIRMQLMHSIDHWIFLVKSEQLHIPQLKIEASDHDTVQCFEKLLELEKMLDPNHLKAYILNLNFKTA